MCDFSIKETNLIKICITTNVQVTPVLITKVRPIKAHCRLQIDGRYPEYRLYPRTFLISCVCGRLSSTLTGRWSLVVALSSLTVVVFLWNILSLPCNIQVKSDVGNTLTPLADILSPERPVYGQIKLTAIYDYCGIQVCLIFIFILTTHLCTMF